MSPDQTLYTEAESYSSAEHALLKTIDTLSICCIKSIDNISLDDPARELADRLLHTGYADVFNDKFCTDIARSTPESVKGSPIIECIGADFKDILVAFFENGCRLYEQSYRIDLENEEATQHFDVNLIGVVTNNELSLVWVRFLETTERLDLEERLISALEQQRTKLARELHDSIGQLLTSVRILSDNLAEKLPESLTREKKLAQQIFEFATEATNEASRLEDGLVAPEELSEEGLVEALEKIRKATDSLPDMSCTFVADADITFEEKSTALQLYRIAQEAVNNAVRHGKPNRIELILTQTAENPVLEISDDGVGFDPEPAEMEGLGLDSMQYRADLIGFDLEIRSTVGEGTIVRCVSKNRRQ